MGKSDGLLQAHKKLNRFSKIEYILKTVHDKKLYLPDYNEWHDKNDVTLLDEYGKRNKDKIKMVRALCFTNGDETIHHWENLGSDENETGCIQFNYDGMIENFNKCKFYKNKRQLFWKDVRYVKIQDLYKGKFPKLKELPFVKRWPYRIENEFRLIQHVFDRDQPREIPISLDLIEKVTISQNVCECEYKEIRKTLQKYIRRINHSKLYEYEKWVNFIKENVA